MYNSIKKTSVIIAAAAFMSISCCVSASAVGNPTNTTSVPTYSTSVNSEDTVPFEMSNPYEAGLMDGDDLNSYAENYLNEGAQADLSGTSISRNDARVTSATTKKSNTVKSETTSAVVTSGGENTSAPAVTSAPSGSTTTSITTPERLDNPYSDGMLSDDELYNRVMDFLDDGTNLNTEGSGMLIGEDIINPEKKEETDTTSEAETYTSGEKVMYTVAASDGSVFYIIIDKGSNGQNVYFLNTVDIVDLASLINSESENLSAQEKAILNKANVTTVSGNEEQDPEAESPDNTTANNSGSANSGNKPSGSAGTTTAQKDDTMLYIIVGGGAVIAIGIGWYFKIGPGKKKKASFDEEDEDDEEEQPEEYYDEEETEEEAPAEEAYEEE